MSRLSPLRKLLPALLPLAATALLASTPATATAQTQPCLTVLDSCQVCVLRTGQIDIRSCGAGEPVGDRLPADLLQKPDVSDLQGLHGVVAKRILDRWEDIVHPVLVPDNGSRIYVPRELYRLALEWSSSEGTGDEWRRFAEMSWARDLIEQASRVRVDAVPTGDGGTKYVIKSTDVLVGYVLRLLDDAGAFSGVDLSKFSPGQLAAAVEGVVDSRLFEELMKTWSRLEAAGTDRQDPVQGSRKAPRCAGDPYQFLAGARFRRHGGTPRPEVCIPTISTTHSGQSDQQVLRVPPGVCVAGPPRERRDDTSRVAEELLGLPLEERLDIAQALWDSAVPQPEIVLTDEPKALLEKRRAEFLADPDACDS